jgi:hypothetical protein
VPGRFAVDSSAEVARGRLAGVGGSGLGLISFSDLAFVSFFLMPFSFLIAFIGLRGLGNGGRLEAGAGAGASGV